MNKVVPICKTRKVMTTVHQVTFDLVPRVVMEKLFYAAIAVGWAADDGLYSSDWQDANDSLQELQDAVSAASQYTTSVEREVEEPIGAVQGG